MSKKQIIALTMLLALTTARAADIAISALPAASSVAGADVVPIVQSGTTKKASFTVQKGLWDTFYQPLDGDLTALAALTGTNTIYYRSAASTWTAVTIVAPLSFSGGNLGTTGTTVGKNFFTLTNPSAIRFTRINADNTVDALSASDFRTAIGAGTGGGDVSSDTATSVDGEIALFKSTTGKLIQRATGTGIATLTSGVLSATATTGSGSVVLATGPTLVTPILGTPTSGTLTNCTGLPVASIVGDTSTALGVGTIELGHATATTLSGSGGVLSVEGVVVPTISSTNTFTNKRNTPRVTSISSSATPTINTDNCDAVTITALATAITSMTTNLSGTPNNFDSLIIRFKDDGTARAITWGASFASSQATLPTTTVISKVLTVGLQWDSVKSKWICLATDQEP